ncbi:autotransporter assembly complex family protein [Yoonia sp. SS1-5]|uniref:Autotransporter assembly complex family protein n=1 Tax=Yoonia rhodophyticola TaxID=3137370 RepID=A0AAN0ME60_9RHOB
MLRRIFVFAAILAGSTTAISQEVRLKTDAARDALDDASLLRQLDDDADPQDYVAAARADYRRLLTALYAEGFYGGTVSITVNGTEAAALSPLAAPGAINEVVITVDPGPRFRFGQTNIEPVAPATAIPDSFATGEAAEADEIRRAVSAAIGGWRDVGHAKARVTDQRVTAQHDESRLNVNVGVNPGPRLTFGNLNISGNEDVRTNRIRQIAGLPTGEVFSPEELTRAERRLRRTGTFDSVAFSEAAEIGPGDTLDINAQLVESKPRRFGFGLELSSIEGLTVSSFWLHRNLLGGAERFRVGGEVSGIGGETGGVDYALRANFTRPATFGADTDFFIRSEISRDDEPTFLLDKISIETGFSRILSDDLTVEAGVGLLRARETSEVGERGYTLLTLPLKATLDRRDEAANPSAGYYLDTTATPFVSLDGSFAGGRVFVDARAYRTFGERLTLAARAQVGSVLGADLDQAPADFLFYSGGGGTVRGQTYQSLGVDRVDGGETIRTGGLSFAGAQLEARFGLNENLSVVGFYDTGYVGETATPLEDGASHAGAGLGIRYNTGIGPIRLDIGTPASGDDAGGSVQVYIGIGQAF